MYEYIRGKVVELGAAYAVVEAGGIGYHLNISLQTFSQLRDGTEAKLYLHFIVRDDARLLYGFADRRERELFRRLISVSGVGAGTARVILSTYSPQELVSIISSENAVLLKNVKGLGLKTAQKIIVELRDKIVEAAGAETASFPGAGVSPAAEETCSEAVAALAMLGFARGASDKAVRTILREDPALGVEELVRRALKRL